VMGALERDRSLYWKRWKRLSDQLESRADTQPHWTGGRQGRLLQNELRYKQPARIGANLCLASNDG
jgi:hypothetical protein